MRLFEILLIAVGVSFDIFARIICLSSSYSKIDRKKVAIYGTVFSIWQLIALALGDITIEAIKLTGMTHANSNMLHFIAIVILATLAIWMLVAGIKGENVVECRNDDVSIVSAIKSGLEIGIRTFFVGVAFGAFETDLVIELPVLIFIAIVMTCCGLYIGYRYGYGFRNKAYFIGSAFLIGTDVFVFCNAFGL
ncbi:MAG: manganese efflux pump [Lachnospiraceae bacterium]|nr:manganese efflux pump [Candidatus Colinaster scatohippi]